MYIAVLLATAASATRTKHPAVIGEAGIGHKASFLGKAATTHDCGADPNCGEQVSMVLVVNNVLQKAQEVEKKAEKQETSTKNLVEAVNEVKASVKAESGARADELAAKEKVEIVEAQVKNEVSEIKAKEQAIEAEEVEAKKITDPAAKAVVQKDEAELEAEVKEEKIEAAVAEEKEVSTKQAEQVVAMESIAAKADEEAKEQKFESEAKSVKQVEKQTDPKAIYKVEMKLYNLQTQVVKDAAKTKDAKPTTPEQVKAEQVKTTVDQIKAAEVPKVQMAVQVINKAKVDAADAKVEEKKALELFKEVELEAKTEEQVDIVMKEFGSVKELDEQMSKCADCLIKHKAAGTKPEPVKLVNVLASRTMTSAKTGDWGTSQCPAGSKVIGGGCEAKPAPWIMQYNGPDGDHGWKCGGHGGPKTVWAMCSTGMSPNIQVKEVGDWGNVQCPEGQFVLSGGCNAYKAPYIMQYNGPNDGTHDGPSGPGPNNGWKCGGHGGPKKVWAVCSGIAETVTKTGEGADWVTVKCDAGKKVIGGGCNADKPPYKMQKNGPDGEDGWTCGGHGGHKNVWAICEK